MDPPYSTPEHAPSVHRDICYVLFLGAEKRTFYEMQRRRFQNVQEDKAEKRDTVDDFLLRELTREERTGTG